MTDFLPCPLCGHPLDVGDIVFTDCEGPIPELTDALKGDGSFDERILDMAGRPDATEEVDGIGLLCPCGFAFWTDRVGSLPDGPAWLDGFAERANRRWHL